MEETQKAKGSMKNIGVIIAFMFVVLIVVTIVVAKLYKKTHTNKMASNSIMTNQIITPVTTMTPMITATPTPNMDTSNTQLDQDLQTAQGSLDKIDINLNSTDQSINNQSADNPQ